MLGFILLSNWLAEYGEKIIEDSRRAARYASLLIAPAEGFGLKLRQFLPGQKQAFYSIVAYFK